MLGTFCWPQEKDKKKKKQVLEKQVLEADQACGLKREQ